jgi:hypothetical protein
VNHFIYCSGFDFSIKICFSLFGKGQNSLSKLLVASEGCLLLLGSAGARDVCEVGYRLKIFFLLTCYLLIGAISPFLHVGGSRDTSRYRCGRPLLLHLVHTGFHSGFPLWIGKSFILYSIVFLVLLLLHLFHFYCHKVTLHLAHKC